MKKIFTMFFLFTVIVLGGCAENKKSIEGYWMSESGETISFNSNGKVIFNGKTMDYSIYGKDNLSISLWGMASEYRYSVEKDVLTLIDLKKKVTNILYRDKEKQSVIQENLRINNEKEKQEEIQKILKDNPVLDETKFVKIVKINLKVPDKSGITYSIGEKRYWDVGQRYYVDVEFFENGKSVAGAFVDPEAGELVRNIMYYSE